jgi:hypothetical protein
VPLSPHKVPTHLDAPDGIGKFSMRQIFLGAAATMYVGPNVWIHTPPLGPSLGSLIRTHYPGLAILSPEGSLPVLPIVATLAAVTPLLTMALPIQPPPEHGLTSAISWARTHGYVTPEQVAKRLGRLAVHGNRVDSDAGIHAVWEMPSMNLRLADAAAVTAAQDLWGEMLSGLTTAIQTITTSNRIDPEKLVGAIAAYRPVKSPIFRHGAGIAATNKTGLHPIIEPTPQDNARRVAEWIRGDVASRHLIERRHFLAIVAPDEPTFTDSEQEIEDGLGTLGFRSDLIRRLEGEELRAVVQRTWSPQPARKKLLGPINPIFVDTGAVFSDDEWHVVLAWGKWPRVLRDNALASLIDGPYDIDVIQHIKPIEADDILDSLERRSGAMKATRPDRKRSLAIDDLDAFILKLEAGEESPFEVAVYLHLHGPKKGVVKQDTKSVIGRVRRSGARANRLTWEQAAAMVAVAPLGVNNLERRTKRVDTSSIKRLYPWSASSMWPDGAIPWGETIDSKRPVGWTPWRRPLIANPHLVVYMMSGGGKGFGWKVWSSRALFGGVTQEFFGFDQAEEDLEMGEYGRWARYCGLEYRHVRSVSDFPAALRDLDNYHWLGPGVEWNIAQLPLADRPRFMAETKAALFKRATEHPARRQWAVDELWSFLKQSVDLGVDPHWLAMSNAAIEDLIRTGRHVQIGGAFFTQRVKDSADVALMQVLQGQAASQMYGMQSAGDISDVRDSLHWTDADVEAIRKFSPGQAILSAGPWRVAMRVTASEDEYAMANTDGRPSREEVAPSLTVAGEEDKESVA